MSAFAFTQLPKPPYYAVIFSSQRTPQSVGYEEAAIRMVELAKNQPGFLGVESVRDAEGFGITVSYWQSEEDITNWKANGEHLQAQEKGMKTWYEGYQLHVAKVTRSYDEKR